MTFLIKDDELLEKHDTTSDKVSADVKKEFDSEPVYNNFFLKPKQNLLAMKLQLFTIKNP